MSQFPESLIKEHKYYETTDNRTFSTMEEAVKHMAAMSALDVMSLNAKDIPMDWESAIKKVLQYYELTPRPRKRS